MKNEHSGKETRVIHYGQIEGVAEGGRKRKRRKKRQKIKPPPIGAPHVYTCLSRSRPPVIRAKLISFHFHKMRSKDDEGEDWASVHYGKLDYTQAWPISLIYPALLYPTLLHTR